MAGRLVQEMRAKIQERTQLTASAGIAPNCFLAKVCSDLNKPNGQFELRPNAEDIMNFVSTLNIRKVGGIGNVQEQLLKGIGVQTCRDLFEKRAEIRLLFSELSSEFYLEVSQGIGSSRIEPPEEREWNTISTETMLTNLEENDDKKADSDNVEPLEPTFLHVLFALRANSQKSKCWVFTLKNVSADKPSPPTLLKKNR